MRRSKAASLHISLATLIDLVLVTLALLVLYGIYKSVMTLFTGNPEKDAATMRNFQELAKKIDQMSNGETREMSLFVNKGYFIVGFEQSKNEMSDACITGVSKTIKKPEATCSNSCICVCSTDDACQKRPICHTIDQKKAYEFRGTKGCATGFIAGTGGIQTITILKEDAYITFGPKP